VRSNGEWGNFNAIVPALFDKGERAGNIPLFKNLITNGKFHL
jgi:hypothetical protein